MSDLVGNPEDRFSHDAAHLQMRIEVLNVLEYFKQNSIH